MVVFVRYYCTINTFLLASDDRKRDLAIALPLSVEDTQTSITFESQGQSHFSHVPHDYSEIRSRSSVVSSSSASGNEVSLEMMKRCYLSRPNFELASLLSVAG